MLSSYWLTGRRRGGRRVGEARSVYVDRYSPFEISVVLAILLLAVLDLVLTLVHLGRGGTEGNPIMAWMLEVGGEGLFVAAKLGVTIAGLAFLLLHVRFRRVLGFLALALAMYVGVLGMHVIALSS
jgi:hypothetical protein